MLQSKSVTEGEGTETSTKEEKEETAKTHTLTRQMRASKRDKWRQKDGWIEKIHADSFERRVMKIKTKNKVTEWFGCCLFVHFSNKKIHICAHDNKFFECFSRTHQHTPVHSRTPPCVQARRLFKLNTCAYVYENFKWKEKKRTQQQ